MSFLANPPAPAPSSEADVVQDGWWPVVSLESLRHALRMDGSVTSERLRRAAIEAIAAVNDELQAWRLRQVEAGHASLAAVPAPQHDGQSVQVQRYLRAIYAATHADLIERLRDFDTTAAGEKKVEALEGSVCELRRTQRWAISDILGIRRSTVELI